MSKHIETIAKAAAAAKNNDLRAAVFIHDEFSRDQLARMYARLDAAFAARAHHELHPGVVAGAREAQRILREALRKAGPVVKVPLYCELRDGLGYESEAEYVLDFCL